MADHDETDSTAEFEKGAADFFDKNIAGGAADDGDDDEDDDTADDADDDAGDDADADDEGDDDADGDDEDDDADDDADGEDEDDDQDDDEDEDKGADEDDDDALDPDFEAAAERHRLPTSFEDVLKKLPKDARPAARKAFAGRLKEVEGGFTRAMQEARRDRKAVAQIRAEKTWIEKNPIDYILDVAEKNPKLFEQLNEELEKMETKAYAEAKKMNRDRAKQEVQDQATKLEAEQTRRAERAEHVESTARSLARTEGIPFRLVERALFIAITQSPERDVTDAQIRRIVGEEAKAYRKETGSRKREDRKTYVRDKVAERTAAKRRPSGRDRGRAPAPGRVREPRSLEEALTRRVSKMDFEGA